MEEISQSFLRPISISAEEVKQHAANLEASKQKGSTEDLPEAPKFYDIVEAKDLATPYYVAVIFTAEYAPPCLQFLPQFDSFMEQMNKDSLRMQVVVVNCDKSQREYDEHIKKLSPKYLVVPFENSEAAIKLEDKAQAQNIPRVSVFISGRGFEQFATLDIKKTIIKSHNMAEAVTEVLSHLQ